MDVLYTPSDAEDVIDWVRLPCKCEPKLLVTSSSGEAGFNGAVKAPRNTMLRAGVVDALLALRSRTTFRYCTYRGGRRDCC